MSLYIYVHVCMNPCIHIYCMHVHVLYSHTYVCMYVLGMCVARHAQVYACMFPCKYVCIHVDKHV